MRNARKNKLKNHIVRGLVVDFIGRDLNVRIMINALEDSHLIECHRLGCRRAWSFPFGRALGAPSCVLAVAEAFPSWCSFRPSGKVLRGRSASLLDSPSFAPIQSRPERCWSAIGVSLFLVLCSRERPLPTKVERLLFYFALPSGYYRRSSADTEYYPPIVDSKIMEPTTRHLQHFRTNLTVATPKTRRRPHRCD